MKCFYSVLCCSNLSFHCSHSTQANVNCVFFTWMLLTNHLKLPYSYNFKTWVPSLPACFEFTLVMHPSKFHFTETLHPGLLVRGWNLLKFLLSPSFCRLLTGVYFVPCCYLLAFWMVEKSLDQNGLVCSDFKTNSKCMFHSKPICGCMSLSVRKLFQLQSEWILNRFLSLSNYFLHLISCWLALSSLSSSALPSVFLLLF